MTVKSFYGKYFKNAQCSKTYTVYCLRATAFQGMNDVGFEIRHIVHMFGHYNESSVRTYNRDCSTVQKMLWTILFMDIPFNTNPTIHGHRFLGLRLWLLQIKKCLLQQLLHLQPYQCNRHIFCCLDLRSAQRSITVPFQFEKKSKHLATPPSINMAAASLDR